MQLKNDKERNAFIEDYRNEENGWYEWKDDGDLQRRWWRRDFNDCAIIIEENLRTHTWPKHMVEWTVVRWYIITDWKRPFADGTASVTEVRNKLKELTVNGKEI